MGKQRCVRPQPDLRRSFVCVCYSGGWQVRVSPGQKRPCTPKPICLQSAAMIARVRSGLRGNKKR